MATGIGILIKGIPVRRLLKAQSGLKNTAEIHRRIGIELVKWGQDNFKAAGLERKWAPLRPSTLYGRRKKGGLPLQDTGELRKSFLSFRATDKEVVWGSARMTALWHHLGTRPYVITPKKKKFLAFPHPEGKKISPKARKTILAAEKKGKFTAFRMAGRSKRDLAGLAFVFAKEVHHPGLPARPLLPSETLAQSISQGVVDGYIKELFR